MTCPIGRGDIGLWKSDLEMTQGGSEGKGKEANVAGTLGIYTLGVR